MEESWENLHLRTEMNCDDDYFIDMSHAGDDEFLKQILLQPAAFSSEIKNDHSFNALFTVQNNTVAAVDGGVLSSEGLEQRNGNMVSSQLGSEGPRCSSSPKTYILSFDDSTMIQATPESYDQALGSHARCSSDSYLPSKLTLQTQNPESRTCPKVVAKKVSTTSYTIEHINAERQRRRVVTEGFIALSTMIPGLSKRDKASVLRATIDYVKQLKERIQELENQDTKRDVETVTVIKKPSNCGNKDKTSRETSSDDGSILPKIKARVLEKDVLIEIHCEKEYGIELKILYHLENLQLCVNGSNVLPFGNSALSITVIAQMGDAYEMKVNDLVKSLRQVLLKS